MDILVRIIKLMKENKTSQKELTSNLGLQNTAFTKWKAGSNNSYLKYLPQIAEYFNVSVDYLIGNTEQKNIPDTKSAEDEKQQIYKIFNQLSPDCQQMVLDQAKALLKLQQNSKD